LLSISENLEYPHNLHMLNVRHCNTCTYHTASRKYG